MVVRTNLIGLALIGLSWIGTAAWGQAPGSPPGGRERDEAEAMFRSLDRNRDGQLTMDEAGPNGRQMLEQIFQMAEKPAGGAVSREEFQRVFEKHRSGGGRSSPRPSTPPNAAGPATPPSPPTDARLWSLLDTDRDQRLTKQELGRLEQLFDQLDANRDGVLEPRELRERMPDSPSESPPASASPAGTPAGGPTSRRPTPDRTRPANPRGDQGRPGNTSLAGVWRGWVVRGTGEDPNSGEMEIELTITDNRMVAKELGTQRAPGGLGAGTFTVMGATAGGMLDADGTEGPQTGRHYQGIYELHGDTLRWCVSNRGRQRPTTMATDRGNYLMILHRVP